MSVGSSVRLSVRRSLFAFLMFIGGFCNTDLAQMLGLVVIITAHAQPHVTWVAVYPALFFAWSLVLFFLLLE